VSSFNPASGQHVIPAHVGGYQRISGVFKNANTLGLLSMQIIFVFIYWWQREKGKATGQLLFLLVGATGAAIVASGSRGSALGLVVGLLVFLIGQSRVRGRTLPALWTVILILLCSFLAVGFFYPEYSGGLFRTGYTSRLILWQRAWVLSQNSPIVGVGFGGSGQLWYLDFLYLQRMGIGLAGPHSSIMLLLVDLGALGIILAGLGFSVLIRRAWKMIPHIEDPQLGICLLAVTAAGLVNSIFESWLFAFGSSSTVPFWLFFALLCHQADQAASRVSQTARDRCAAPKQRFHPAYDKRRPFGNLGT
jgi:O-antigen ligase